MSEYKLGDYNRGGYIAFMFSMAFTMAFFIYIAFLHPGINLNEIQKQEIQKEQQKEAPVAQPAAEQPAQEKAPEQK